MDSVIISKTEFDNVLVWNERLFASMHAKPGRLRKLRPENPKNPPPKEEEENAKNG